MVRNAWQGNYWLGSDGKMATRSWVDNGRYYVDANGAWVKDAKKPEESKPAEKKQGWKKEGNSCTTTTKDKWLKTLGLEIIWLGSDGKMATNSWVDNDRYYVGANGVLEKDKKKRR